MNTLPDTIRPALVRQPMRGGKERDLLRSHFAFPTSARFAYASSQLVFSDDCRYPAATTARIERFTGRIDMMKGEDEPAIKLLPDDFRHGEDIMNKQLVVVKIVDYHGD